MVKVLLALAISTAATPLAAADMPGAPPGTPSTLYCMKVTITGNIAEPVQCWTRAEWAYQDVDVDREWAKNGVSVVG